MHGVVTGLGKERGQREACASRTEFLPVHVSDITEMGRGKEEREGPEKVEKG